MGFVTFDAAVHFYNLKPGLKAPAQIVVPDVNELFVPVPDVSIQRLLQLKLHTDAAC